MSDATGSPQETGKLTQEVGSAFTCFGEGDEVARDEILEVPVSVRERFPQDGLQPPEERHRVQAVEGEAAGERQQVAGPVDGSGRRVCHHVPIHRTVQSRCTQEEAKYYNRRCTSFGTHL